MAPAPGRRPLMNGAALAGAKRTPGRRAARLFALALACIFFASTEPGSASPPSGAGGQLAFDCHDERFRWSRDRPKVNLRHLFCGELDDGRPKGLHSTRLAATWDVVRRIEQRREEGGGIYSAVVVFSGGQRKLSTFFPDHCTEEQIIRSIKHAASSPLGPHKQWGEIGLSSPEQRNIRDRSEADHEMFCLDSDGRPFEIRFGVLADGRINTAFPN